ncbi:MAG TPA: DUF2764 family protein [Rhabdochlamydiaceae bacterium]|jgi:hypothetical protein
MKNYYYLVPSLPPLSLSEKPELSFEKLAANLEISLTREDLEKTRVLRCFVDINNIRFLLLEERIDPHGNLNEKQLDEALLIKNILPEYVFDFLDQFEKVSERIRNFTGLLSAYFVNEIPKASGFLKDYLIFERQSRLVLLALRAKRLGRDVVKELQFEDMNDPFIAQIIAQKDAERYEPPEEYKELEDLLASCYGDPWLENRVFAEYRFKKIEEMAEREQFTIDQILAYMAKLMIVEYILELDEEKGKLILDTFKIG